MIWHELENEKTLEDVLFDILNTRSLYELCCDDEIDC